MWILVHSFRCAGGDDVTLRRPMVCGQEHKWLSVGGGPLDKNGLSFLATSELEVQKSFRLVCLYMRV